MSLEYWSKVGEKFLSLGKTALNLAAPVAIDFAVTKAVEKTCSVIETKLKDFYKKTLINTAISFVLNLAGVLVLIFKPFGTLISRCVAVFFFISAFIYWLVRTILFIKNYGKTTLNVSKNVIKQKSVYKGIEQYILSEFPLISIGYTGIAIASEFIPFLKEIPRISEFVKYIVKIFWKRVAIFLGIMVIYAITILWIIKPLLVKQFF